MYMPSCLYVHHMCAGAMEARKERWILGTGVSGCCELSDVGSGNQTGSSGRAESSLNCWARDQPALHCSSEWGNKQVFQHVILVLSKKRPLPPKQCSSKWRGWKWAAWRGLQGLKKSSSPPQPASVFVLKPAQVSVAAAWALTPPPPPECELPQLFPGTIWHFSRRASCFCTAF